MRGANMKVIETTALIAPSGLLTLHANVDLPAGEHRVVLVINEAVVPERARPLLRFPVHDSIGGQAGGEVERDSSSVCEDFPVVNVDSWPAGLSLRREDMYDDWGR